MSSTDLEKENASLKQQLAETQRQAESYCSWADECERLRDRAIEELTMCKARLAAYDTAPRIEPERRSSPAPPELQSMSAEFDREPIEAVEENQRVGNAPPTKARTR